ncbi:hypothetical protein EG834_03760 [bacterium]|nr:hypothetical protein [bacterium]
MPYPLSSPVSAGQPTQASHYNDLRTDATRLGQAPADSVDLATFFKRFAQAIVVTYLATARIRIPYNAAMPPTIMINGYMLQANANVDLPAGLFSGAAQLWYIFAVRTPGSSTFTLSVNTSPIETTDQRLIGSAQWDGAKISGVWSDIPNATVIPNADYDSGWFAVAPAQVITKAHGLAGFPRLVQLFHCTNTGTAEWMPVHLVENAPNIEKQIMGVDDINVNINTGFPGDVAGTCFNTRRDSTSGFYRILAWK